MLMSMMFLIRIKQTMMKKQSS